MTGQPSRERDRYPARDRQRCFAPAIDQSKGVPTEATTALPAALCARLRLRQPSSIVVSPCLASVLGHRTPAVKAVAGEPELLPLHSGLCFLARSPPP